ncbi:MAG: DUF11 domain-containing protein [Thermoleophilia bacterium]|nr:DUF11 domain-containing protein [Thermoleophilia bacterium]
MKKLLSRSRRILLLAIFPIAVTGFTLGFTTSSIAAPPESLDLKVTKAVNASTAKVGSRLTYTIVASNLGTTGATGVSISDQLPKQVDLVSAKSTSGTCKQAGNKVTCTIGNIAAGSVTEDTSVTVTVVAVVRDSGTVTNTATIAGDQKDPVKANDKASAKTTVAVPSKPVTCAGVTATVVGTSGRDQLVGTSGRDVVAAFGGADRIATFSGRDLVCAGRGNDYVLSGADGDRVLGGPGADRLVGRSGADLLKGNAGNDVLKGNRGNDRLRGGFGFDLCRGGAGADLLTNCER